MIRQEDFWLKVHKAGPNDCWEWQCSRHKQGYGHLVTGGVYWLAHRLAWLFTHGILFDDEKVLHTCDNPPCVNPQHLWTGTQKDNMQDCAAKGRIFNRWGVRG